MLDVAVIGVGLAGIFAARELQSQGLTVELFDKSRGVGGRLATRRGFETRFDHGLPSWEVQGKHTEELTELLLSEKLIAPWKIAFTDSSEPKDWKNLPTESVFCVPDGMTAIAKYLAKDLNINRSFHLDSLEIKEDSCQLTFKNGEVISVKKVVLAVPAPQAIPLVQPFIDSEMGDRLNQISYEPALSLMLGFEELVLDFPWQELRLENHPIYKKIILDGQKRSPSTQTLVVQTNDTFTEQYLDANDLEPATQSIISALKKDLELPKPNWHQIHRWRYALPDQTLEKTHLQLATSFPLVLCGDWCIGNGIEGTIASGCAAAKFLMNI